jgi:hypothetical protein
MLDFFFGFKEWKTSFKTGDDGKPSLKQAVFVQTVCITFFVIFKLIMKVSHFLNH